MRLLRNSAGELSLSEDFIDDDIPKYAILSHTWGADTDEVTFQDLIDGTNKDKAGYEKIYFCEKQARCDGLQYFWVDTCCIDKSNSTELSEAINSMFRWYQNATKCYVYLSDVSIDDHDQVDSPLLSWLSAFQNSRWFTRGWTLQELIAPRSVEFFCSNGKRLGDKKSLERQLHEISGIAVLALQGASLSTFSVDERMSWAKNRETRREEDKAYSLLGIFGINMPLIYGERVDSAFRRLREELYKRGKKRHLDELSSVLQPLDSTKRLLTLHSRSCSAPTSHDPNFLDPEPVFHPEYSVHNIDNTTKQSLIDQLYFAKIDERLTNLTAAQGSTCRWFLTKSEYTSWYNVLQYPDHCGFLWIQGHPGTGKSTLMKLLFEEAKLNARGNPSQITLSFFFLARGTVEEKSATGLYRSLLHQLFEKAVDLRDGLEWMTADGARGIQRNGWHEEALKQTLTHAVQKLGSRSLMIFIDALDECDQNHAASMVCFFEELCDLAREEQVQLRICFSSRHYPTIIIQKGVEITLEHEIGHTEDIKQYIRSKLRLGKSKQAESLRSDILEKSRRIFLWVVLVLDILNSEYPNSSISIKKISERLIEIPPELSDLFEMILARDGENLEQLQVCLKWILFASRPLKPQELYFAIQLGLDKCCSSFWDQEDIDLDQIKTFVRSSSKGLAEVTRNKASEVQFIHESVRDFLLGKYESQWSGGSGNFVGHSHEILRDCCLAQLNALISQEVDIPDPLPQASKAAPLRETIRLKFPFLEYSVLNVLYHSNSAQQSTIDQRDFLHDFPLQRWIFLKNTLEKYEIRRYTESVSMLYVLAEKNLADLIQVHPERESCFDVEDERYGPPFFAALAASSSEAVCTFLNIQAETRSLTSPLHDLYNQYYQNRNKWANLGRGFHFLRGRTVSSYVAENGDEILLHFLIELGQCMPNSKDKDRRTPLSYAAGNGQEATIQLLLRKGADIDVKGVNRRTPLSYAAGNGHRAVVQLLLEKGADIEAEGVNGQTPLSYAAKNGHKAVVQLLLEKGADIDAKDNRSYGRTPLSWAAENGHKAVVQLLLEKGADIEAEGANGQTPLSYAAKNGHKAVAQLLLEKGANIEAKDSSKKRPLSYAAENGHEAVVQLLLEKGADIEAKDISSWTPLMYAAAEGRKAVVQLLLEKGADIEAKCGRRWTSLFYAADRDQEATVQLLLDKGADIEAEGANGQTPLSYAAKNGHKATVQLLLKKGADIEAKDNRSYGRTPLSWAAGNGHEATVQLLLEKGADIEAEAINSWTPLMYAAAEGCKAVVQLLLEKGADIEANGSRRWTPLSYAAANGHEAIVDLLRKHVN